MRGILRRLGCWERVGSDGDDEPPKEVVREVENAAEAYERVHDDKPHKQVFEVEYGDSLYRARFGRDGEGRYYRAPKASAPYRTALALRSIGRGTVGAVQRLREDPAAFRTRKTAFSAFVLAVVVGFLASAAGFGVVGSPGENATNPEGGVAVNGPAEVLNGTFVFNAAQTERLIFEEANEVRKEHGVGATRRVESLSVAATVHAGNMAENEYVGHVTPTGDNVGDRYSGSCDSEGSRGYTAQRYTENAAAVTFDEPLDDWNGTQLKDEEEVAEFVVEAWMESPDHRDNLLEAEHEGMGVGVEFRDGKVFAVQAFCGSVSG